MRDESGKIVSPEHFIAAAERYNIMPAIDRWVIENTLRWLVSEADERERLSMCAINLSGQSLGDDKFLPFVIEQFQKSGLDASKICFEITETAAVASFSQANRFIRSLKELGCKFSLDDFGTGMSSFNYLKQFPVDYLKIDGSFVRDMLDDPVNHAMVEAIHRIGHIMGKKTIAESVENRETLRALSAIGVDYAQGYAIAMPASAPSSARIVASASRIRRRRPALEPSAHRTANSRSRRSVRVSTRLATFAHAVTSTSAATAISRISVRRALDVRASRSGVSVTAYPAALS
jgi:EAL domain-containing protein (putative c-di-GMP-specific phosphodiesterase class I)